MTDNALIVSVEKSQIQVVPLITGACINCANSSCAKRGKPFPVSNPKGLPISVGSIVRIQASKKMQIVQGFVALLLPIAFAVALYFLGGFLSQKFGWQKTELFQALGVLVGIFVPSVIIYFLNAKNRKIKKCEIYEVVS